VRGGQNRSASVRGGQGRGGGAQPFVGMSEGKMREFLREVAGGVHDVGGTKGPTVAFTLTGTVGGGGEALGGYGAKASRLRRNDGLCRIGVT